MLTPSHDVAALAEQTQKIVDANDAEEATRNMTEAVGPDEMSPPSFAPPKPAPVVLSGEDAQSVEELAERRERAETPFAQESTPAETPDEAAAETTAEQPAVEATDAEARPPGWATTTAKIDVIDGHVAPPMGVARAATSGSIDELDLGVGEEAADDTPAATVPEPEVDVGPAPQTETSATTETDASEAEPAPDANDANDAGEEPSVDGSSRTKQFVFAPPGTHGPKSDAPTPDKLVASADEDFARLEQAANAHRDVEPKAEPEAEPKEESGDFEPVEVKRHRPQPSHSRVVKRRVGSSWRRTRTRRIWVRPSRPTARRHADRGCGWSG